MRRRRIAAPAFHQQRIAAYADVIAGYPADMTKRWQPGAVDLHPHMLLLALRIGVHVQHRCGVGSAKDRGGGRRIYGAPAAGLRSLQGAAAKAPVWLDSQNP